MKKERVLFFFSIIIRHFIFLSNGVTKGRSWRWSFLLSTFIIESGSETRHHYIKVNSCNTLIKRWRVCYFFFIWIISSSRQHKIELFILKCHPSYCTSFPLARSVGIFRTLISIYFIMCNQERKGFGLSRPYWRADDGDSQSVIHMISGKKIKKPCLEETRGTLTENVLQTRQKRSEWETSKKVKWSSFADSIHCENHEWKSLYPELKSYYFIVRQ